MISYLLLISAAVAIKSHGPAEAEQPSLSKSCSKALAKCEISCKGKKGKEALACMCREAPRTAKCISSTSGCKRQEKDDLLEGVKLMQKMLCSTSHDTLGAEREQSSTPKMKSHDKEMEDVYKDLPRFSKPKNSQEDDEDLDVDDLDLDEFDDKFDTFMSNVTSNSSNSTNSTASDEKPGKENDAASWSKGVLYAILGAMLFL